MTVVIEEVLEADDKQREGVDEVKDKDDDKQGIVEEISDEGEVVEKISNGGEIVEEISEGGEIEEEKEDASGEKVIIEEVKVTHDSFTGDDGGEFGSSEDEGEPEKDAVIFVDSKKKEETAEETYRKREAELATYLESLNPQPKRKSLKEKLLAMSGYKEIASLKPKLGGGDKDFVILDGSDDSKRKSKRQEEIEKLKDRFVKHAWVAPPKPKQLEHVKLKISKKEEDSQGVEHLVEGEVDYVRNPLIEDEEANLVPEMTSPTAQPGARYTSLRQNLMAKIKQKKMAEYEERVKEYAMYNDELDVEGKDEEEEVIEDEDEMNSEDSEGGEEEEDEDLEGLLSGPKEKKKKSRFIDDEAEDEDGDDDDSEESSEDEEEKEKVEVDGAKGDVELESGGLEEDDDDSLPDIDELFPTQKKNNSESTTKDVNEDSTSMEFGVDVTPKSKVARTPTGFWKGAKLNVNSRHSDELSPLIPTNPRETNTVVDSLANVISESKAKFDDLVDLCSGKFVTQKPAESQEDDEFSNFDFGDDDIINNGQESATSDVIKTPVASSKNLLDGITPKLTRPSIARRSMQFDLECESDRNEIPENENSTEQPSKDFDDDDDEEVVIKRKSFGKQKRLQFSDDEDSENEAIETNEPDPSEDEKSDLEDETQEEVMEEEPKANNPFFNKYGKLKRKFVEDEAELSGSEEGSGDEDERGLNHYDKELLDDDELDEDEVRKQVERAHLKELLDEDDRNIRHLQNMYLESGDLHMDGMERKKDRKFKWAIPEGVLTDDAIMGESDEEQEETQEQLTEKAEMIAKRKWLSENSHLLEEDLTEQESLFTGLKLKKKTIKKIESFVEESQSVDILIEENSNKKSSILEDIIKMKRLSARLAPPKTDDNLVTSHSEGFGKESEESSSKSMSEGFFGAGVTWSKTKAALQGKRGSLLCKDEKVLAKLAETTRPSDTISNVKNNSRSFVFSHITPPTQDKANSRVKRTKKEAQATKKLKVDRSFNSLDEASKQGSIFQFL